MGMRRSSGVVRWDFARAEGDRLIKLKSPPTFESIVENIKATMTVLCCHSDPICGTDFKRVAYCIRVGKDLFDAFFNSQTGYRAWYHLSPYEGLRINAYAMQALSPKLIAAASTNESGLSTALIGQSLKTTSSKIWLVERGNPLAEKESCSECGGEWASDGSDDAEILNDRWELTEHYKAKWGRCAPYLTQLRIFGAFLDANHNEFIPENKRFRAKELYDWGWS